MYNELGRCLMGLVEGCGFKNGKNGTGRKLMWIAFLIKMVRYKKAGIFIFGVKTAL